MIHRNYFLFVLFLFSSLFSYNISGFIKDASNGEPIPFSNTTIQKSSSDKIIKGTSSDINGYFIITGLYPGNYMLTTSTIGYELSKKEILIESSENQKNIRLDIQQ